jgi:hypothetical protein
MGAGFPWGWWKCLELDWGGGWQHYKCTKCHQTVPFKMVNFMWISPWWKRHLFFPYLIFLHSAHGPLTYHISDLCIYCQSFFFKCKFQKGGKECGSVLLSHISHKSLWHFRNTCWMNELERRSDDAEPLPPPLPNLVLTVSWACLQGSLV